MGPVTLVTLVLRTRSPKTIVAVITVVEGIVRVTTTAELLPSVHQSVSFAAFRALSLLRVRFCCLEDRRWVERAFLTAVCLCLGTASVHDAACVVWGGLFGTPGRRRARNDASESCQGNDTRRSGDEAEWADGQVSRSADDARRSVWRLVFVLCVGSGVWEWRLVLFVGVSSPCDRLCWF